MQDDDVDSYLFIKYCFKLQDEDVDSYLFIKDCFKLQDEDVEIRNAATNFAAQIKRSQLISQHEEINTSLGKTKRIIF